MDKKTEKNSPRKQGEIPETVESKKLRCINIDCVFNSSNEPEQDRNFCNHPNLKVESRFADITIAICSEFRSKKDYIFEKPSQLVEKKTKEKIEIKGAPEPSFTHIEKVTTEELEHDVEAKRSGKRTSVTRREGIPDRVSVRTEYEKPKVIRSADEKIPAAEQITLAGSPQSNLQILKKLYQPYLKRGIIFSITVHLICLWFLYILFLGEEEEENIPLQQRIVVVEDVETPKFDPPDLDKPKEPENVADLTKDVRPKIEPKDIKPKIKRPVDETADTTEQITETRISDSLKAITDSLLALQMSDTTRLTLADSLKNFMPENEIGMQLWYPKNWKLTDNRSVNLNINQFMGVIINTDSASEDPGAVSIFIQIDDPKHSSYNKTVFKNTFAMDDTNAIAFSTDPTLTGSQRISYKFFIFTDPTGQKNVYVNSEAKKDMFDKYKIYIEAIVRSIKIISKTTLTPEGTSK